MITFELQWFLKENLECQTLMPSRWPWSKVKPLKRREKLNFTSKMPCGINSTRAKVIQSSITSFQEQNGWELFWTNWNFTCKKATSQWNCYIYPRAILFRKSILSFDTSCRNLHGGFYFVPIGIKHELEGWSFWNIAWSRTKMNFY